MSFLFSTTLLLLFTAPLIKVLTGFGVMVDLLGIVVLAFVTLTRLVSIKPLPLNISSLNYVLIFCLFSILYFVYSLTALSDLAFEKVVEIFFTLNLVILIIVGANKEDAHLFLNYLLFFVVAVLMYEVFYNDSLFSLYKNRLQYGLIIGSAFLVSIVNVFYSNKKYHFLLISAMLFGFLLISNNRGAVLFSFLVALSLTVYLKRSVLLLIALLLMMGFLFFSYVYLFSENEYLVKRLTEMSYDSRIPLFMEGYRVFLENPLGVGIGGFGVKSIYPEGSTPHNIFIESFVEMGIIGGGLLVFFFTYSFAIIMRFIKKHNSSLECKERRILAIKLFSIAVFIFFNLNKSYSLSDIRFILIPLSMIFPLLRHKVNV